MGTLRRIVLAALIAGATAGLVAAAVQSVTTWPTIRIAERFEHAPRPFVAAYDVVPPLEPSRAALTVLTDVLIGIGYALMLAAVIALTGVSIDARRGLLWGAAGFAAFALAPALGLPPTLPGMAETDLAARQTWWIATAACTASGFWLIAFKRGAAWIAAAVVLIALPHLVGAPQAAGGFGVPASLAARFAAASLGTSAVFWLVLGAATGGMYARLIRAEERV